MVLGAERGRGWQAQSRYFVALGASRIGGIPASLRARWGIFRIPRILVGQARGAPAGVQSLFQFVTLPAGNKDGRIPLDSDTGVTTLSGR